MVKFWVLLLLGVLHCVDELLLAEDVDVQVVCACRSSRPPPAPRFSTRSPSLCQRLDIDTCQPLHHGEEAGHELVIGQHVAVDRTVVGSTLLARLLVHSSSS